MWLIAWPVFCVILGMAASRHFNRSGIGWGCLAFLISPLFAFLFLLAAGKKKDLARPVQPAAAPRADPLAAMTAPPRSSTIEPSASWPEAGEKPASWGGGRSEPRLLAMLALAVGLGLAAAPAYAGEGLTFGGATLCSTVLESSPEELEKWGSWIMGYWSGLNSMVASGEAWTGEKLGGKGILSNSVSECVLNRHQTIQDAVNAAYSKAEGTGL